MTYINTSHDAMNISKEREGAWYGVDLDGTLAHYESGQGIDTVGAPVPLMVERVRAMLAEGKTVKIMTARVYYNSDWDKQGPLIRAWCMQHIGRELDITATKDFKMVALYDDRAIGVLKNQGVLMTEVYREIGACEGRKEIMSFDQANGMHDDPDVLTWGRAIEMRLTHDGQCLTVREARVLAARLLKAANDAERLT